jgi:hypothetical protein
MGIRGIGKGNSPTASPTNRTHQTAVDYMVAWTKPDAAQQDRQTVISLEDSYGHALRAYVAYFAELTLQLREQNV